MTEIIDLLLSYAPAQVIVLIMTLKGIASIVANNYDTQEWGKVGDFIEVLASNTKGAKLTKSEAANAAVKEALEHVAPKTIVGKLLRMFS